MAADHSSSTVKQPAPIRRSAPAGATARCWPSSSPRSTPSPGAGCKPASPSAGAPTTTRQPGLCSPDGAASSTPSSPNCRRSGHSSPGDMPGRSARPRATRRPAAA